MYLLRVQAASKSFYFQEMERENMFNTDVLRENEESFNTTIDISTKVKTLSLAYKFCQRNLSKVHD